MFGRLKVVKSQNKHKLFKASLKKTLQTLTSDVLSYQELSKMETVSFTKQAGISIHIDFPLNIRAIMKQKIDKPQRFENI